MISGRAPGNWKGSLSWDGVARLSSNSLRRLAPGEACMYGCSSTSGILSTSCRAVHNLHQQEQAQLGAVS